MGISPGSRIGPYEVTALIGEGGMGKVWRARHTALKRDDALKVLPDAFANDPDRLARFQREAQVLASLNHPNIARVYGLEESDGTKALVMELIEGPTISERIDERPISIGETLSIAKQIADALEAAHEKGIVHRDLKPANVKVCPNGTVKVLDFGLAKAMAPADGVASNVTISPTITSPAMTQVGILLGTAAYMSPEQAKGRAADKRSDIWAFGCVLYEMLTGARAFGGDDVSDTLAFVLAREPDWSALPARTPAAIRKLLHRCLQRDPKRRLSDIADARLEIDEALAMPTEADDATRPVDRPLEPMRWKRSVPWALAGALGSALTLALILWAPWRQVSAPAPFRLVAELGVDASIDDDPGGAVALSRDGALLAFVARRDEKARPQLYLRRLDQLQAISLAGTEDAVSPFFSPDGAWIAFFAGGKLKKISVSGGAAVTLSDAPTGRGGTWAEDDTIIFNPDVPPGVSLMRVSSAGGKAEPFTTIAEGEVTHRWPQVLPGGRALLYTSHTGLVGFDAANVIAQPLPSGTPKVVQRGGYYGRFLGGHLVYIYEGTLFAAPFDLDRLEVTGQPVPVVEGVDATSRSGGANFGSSTNGTLVYLPGRGVVDELPLDWLDASGKTTPLRATPANWSNVRFAPDGRRLAMDINDGRQSDVWIYEWEGDRLSRLTLDANLDEKPVWTPDGQRIVFASRRGTSSVVNLYWQRADGTGEVQRLTDSSNPQWPNSWHPSGKFLAFSEQSLQSNEDILILPLEGDERSGWKAGKATVFANGPSREREPMFSPDGRWLAYVSNESGRSEVYVRPFSGSRGAWMISTGGGSIPTWSQTRHELFYQTPDFQIMVVPYSAEDDAFRPEKPRLWSERRYRRVSGPTPRSFDLHPDGNRFALAVAPEAQTEAKRDRLVFIFNFFDELRRVGPNLK